MDIKGNVHKHAIETQAMENQNGFTTVRQFFRRSNKPSIKHNVDHIGIHSREIDHANEEYIKTNKNSRDVILVCLSATLLGAAFWKNELAILILIALIPLFVVIFPMNDIRKISKYGILFSFLSSMLLTSWLVSLYPMEFMGFTKITGLVIVLAWLVFAFLLSIPMSLYFIVLGCYTRPGFSRSLVAASLWAIMEAGMELSGMGFPWFRLALPLASLNVLAQPARLIGSLGLSFLVVFVSGCGAQFIMQRKIQPEACKKALVVGCLTIVAGIGYGWNTTHGKEPNGFKDVDMLAWQGDGKTDIAILQGNLSSDDKWEVGREWDHFAGYRKMTLEAIKQGADLIVWPETALPIALNEIDEMMDELYHIASSHQVTLVVGAFYQVNDDDKTNDGLNIRAEEKTMAGFNETSSSNERTWMNQTYIEEQLPGLYNALYSFPEQQLYLKQHLVPIGEYMPNWMMSVFPFLRSFQMANQLTPASSSVQLVHGDWRIGGLICFESIFPQLSRNHVGEGANLLLIASNDAWYQHSAEITQHMNHAILRAIENNRYVLRSANTGISAIIDPKGRVMAQMREDEAGIVYGRIAPMDEVSLYHQFPYLVLLVSALILVCNRKGFAWKRIGVLGNHMKHALIRFK